MTVFPFENVVLPRSVDAAGLMKNPESRKQICGHVVNEFGSIVTSTYFNLALELIPYEMKFLMCKIVPSLLCNI